MQNSSVRPTDVLEKYSVLMAIANRCRDILRFRARHPVADIESIMEYMGDESEIVSDCGILEALTGSKKADQNRLIYGEWECEFTR